MRDRINIYSAECTNCLFSQVFSGGGGGKLFAQILLMFIIRCGKMCSYTRENECLKKSNELLLQPPLCDWFSGERLARRSALFTDEGRNGCCCARGRRRKSFEKVFGKSWSGVTFTHVSTAFATTITQAPSHPPTDSSRTCCGTDNMRYREEFDLK